MTIKIKLPSVERPPPPQAQVELQVKKTLEGNLLISDHDHMDIVVVPAANKILTLPKPMAEKDIYEYQRDFMYSLFKGGLINADAAQGGPRFGIIEAQYAAEGSVDPLQSLLLQIESWIQKSQAQMLGAIDYNEDIEDHFVDPTDKDSTEYGSIPPYQDTPQGAQDAMAPYSYAGYGYLY
jgi:hypothetical protein